MNDHDLDGLVRALPPVSASPGFEARVLRRVAEGRGRSRRRIGVLAMAGGLAASLVVVVPVLRARQQEHHRAELRAEVLALRAAVDQLQAGVAPPLVYVGGDDRVDLLVDPRTLAQAGGPASAPSYRGEEL
jgi:predicted NBD/HSP70 family sugar kinase